jgi:hypothetical protein
LELACEGAKVLQLALLLAEDWFHESHDFGKFARRELNHAMYAIKFSA